MALSASTQRGGPTPDPALAIARGAGLPALVAVALTTLVAVVGGGRAVAGAAVGGLLAVAAMTAVPLVMRWSRAWSPLAVTAAGAVTYLVTLGVAGLASILLAEVDGVSSGWLGAGLAVGVIAWSAGLVKAVTGLRELAFGAGDTASDQH